MTGLHYFTDWGCKCAVQRPSLIFIIWWKRRVDSLGNKDTGKKMANSRKIENIISVWLLNPVLEVFGRSKLQLLPYLQNPLSLKYLQSLGCLLLHFLLSHSSRRQISSKWIFLQLASHLQNPNLLNIQTSPVIFDFIFLV